MLFFFKLNEKTEIPRKSVCCFGFNLLIVDKPSVFSTGDKYIDEHNVELWFKVSFNTVWVIKVLICKSTTVKQKLLKISDMFWVP